MDNIKTAVLTVAGSDSGGGAGIQADLRTFSIFKVYGCSVITAVTAQNPDEVRKVEVLTAEIIESQLECILDAIPVKWAKTGMLANRETIDCISRIAEKHRLNLVVDPVMVSTSGSKLLEDQAVGALKEKIFPQAKWITPNIPEAELICQCKLNGIDDFAAAAIKLYKEYNCNVILKSGHAVSSSQAVDIICHQGKLFTLSSPEVKLSGNTAHGTGCTLSAALAANLATGNNWQDACIAAKEFVYGSLVEKAALTNTLWQMYPPQGNYHNEIILKEL